MSVDCSAVLGYGWILDPEELSDRFHELNEDDFEPLNGKYEKSLGSYYTCELAMRIDDYAQKSPYFIGVTVDTRDRVVDGPGSCDWHFRDLGAAEFSSRVLGLMHSDEKLHELYLDVMGDKPKSGPKMHLFESWW